MDTMTHLEKIHKGIEYILNKNTKKLKALEAIEQQFKPEGETISYKKLLQFNIQFAKLIEMLMSDFSVYEDAVLSVDTHINNNGSLSKKEWERIISQVKKTEKLK